MTGLALLFLCTIFICATAFHHNAPVGHHRFPSRRKKSSWLQQHHEKNSDNTINLDIINDPDEEGGTDRSRRMLIVSAACITAASVMSVDVTASSAAQEVAATATANSSPSLTTSPWKVDPVNKRYGTTVTDAERVGYSVAFVTYLSRFLLNFDSNCQLWWFSTKIPKNATPQQIEELRIKQFASFSASVEVAIQEDGYATTDGRDGAERLLKDLVRRYGTVKGSINDVPEDGTRSTESERRMARSARRQLALCFALLEKNQPVKQITKLLASVDNGGIMSIKMAGGDNTLLGGYDAAKPPPKVIIPPPAAGETYEAAEAQAILKATGRLLRIDVLDGGSGYLRSNPPDIIITGGDTSASAKANIASDGSIDSVQLLEAGSGYLKKDQIHFQVVPSSKDSRTAVLSPVLDMTIDKIEVTRKGNGYAVEKPLKIYVEPPEPTNDDSKYVQVGIAYPISEKTSFTAFRRDSDKKRMKEFEEEFEAKYRMGVQRKVSGVDGELPQLPFWNGEKSTSAELLRLLPAGIGLEYDSVLKRYGLSADTDFLNKYPAALQQSSRPLGLLEYGPRGRAPLMRDMKLGLTSYLRFGLGGAVCASGIHTFLNPLELVKTKCQVDSDKYPSLGSSFKKIWNEEGPQTFMTGWMPTSTGHFVAGGLLYMVTEIIRRSLSQTAGVDAVNLQVPIILTAAAIASLLNAIIICPFEAVRIRYVLLIS